MKRVLQGTRKIPSNDLASTYLKRGGYAQAYSDFKMLAKTNIEQTEVTT